MYYMDVPLESESVPLKGHVTGVDMQFALLQKKNIKHFYFSPMFHKARSSLSPQLSGSDVRSIYATLDFLALCVEKVKEIQFLLLQSYEKTFTALHLANRPVSVPC